LDLENFPVKARKGMFDRCLDILNGAMAALGALCVIFMMLAISYAVVLRYLWDQPVAWVVEISSYLMLYITFLGTAWLLRKDGHVEVDLFLGNMRPRVRSGFKAVTYIGGAVVGFVLFWKGLLVTIDSYQRGVTVIGILNTPQFLLVGIIPVGGALLLLEFTLKICRFVSIVLGKETSTGSSPENGVLR
jgi:TRAP-type C4-dicarboxylate transport system permease small subunit